MAKKKAPVQLTGGEGFGFEDLVAARLLLDLLAGFATLGDALGLLERLHWQARDMGWLADDLVGEFRSAEGSAHAGFSVKHDRQVTRSGFPNHFVDATWRHACGRGAARLLGERDAIVLVVAKLANDVGEAWQKLLSEACATTEERLVARLEAQDPADGVQSSEVERALFRSLRCPEGVVDGAPPGDTELVRTLRQIRVLHLDFGTETSVDQARAYRDAQDMLRDGDGEHARALWHRLVGIAAERRTKGGALDLQGLLAELRGAFQLREHPDYRADLERLEALSKENVLDVRTSIANLPALERADALDGIAATLAESSTCIVAGESGVGKSALAKTLGARDYERLVWLNAELLAGGSRDALVKKLGLNHALHDVLASSTGTALLVVDGAERLRADGCQVVARLTRDLDAVGAHHVHVLLTVGLEAASRVSTWFLDAQAASPRRVVLEAPREEDVRALVRGVAGLRWAACRSELKPMLRNLKVLEWVVHAVMRGAVLDEGHVVNVSGLIDYLWARWIEGDEQRNRWSDLMMRLATEEAARLASGVARTCLGHDVQDVLKQLVDYQLLRLHDERVSFAHDMVGDWARLRVLIAEVPDSLSTLRSRADRIRWHRAIRLYGQRLIDTEGASTWLESVEAVDDGTYAGIATRDLLLEAAFLASNADVVLEAVWPQLIADECRLLRLMLERFLYVGTAPDPTMDAVLDGELRHQFRVPLTPYWGGVLLVLHRHQSEVAQRIPVLAARVAGMWLKWTQGAALQPSVLWRREAAELVLELARNSQIDAEIHGASAKDWKPVFEALLYASHDLPVEVVALCLELCHRRPLPPALVAMRDEVRKEREEQRRQWERDHPDKAAQFKQLTTSPIPRGSIREPWSDGPSNRVVESFCAACRDAGAFAALVSTDAAAAREVLLAVCIGPPARDEPYNTRHDDLGLAWWNDGYPSMYFQGPFLRFLREAPDEGLTFVLRLVNFATERWADQQTQIIGWRAGPHGGNVGVPGAAIGVYANPPVWIGDETVFRWSAQSSLGNGAVHCCLMALERWLYDEVDGGNDVEGQLRRILHEGASMAFGGVLVNLAKRHPELLIGPLLPVLTTWELHVLDAHDVSARSSSHWDLISWGGQPEVLVQHAREWFEMPHRQVRLWDVVAKLMLTREGAGDVIADAREKWREVLTDEGPRELEHLIARLDPTNYVARRVNEREVEITVRWPEKIEQCHQRDMPEIERNMEIMVTPMRCRKWLSGEEPVPPGEAARLWELAERLEPQVASGEPDDAFGFLGPRDAFFGAVSVLLILKHEWLSTAEGRAERCRDWLACAVDTVPSGNRYAEHMVTSENRFDSFVAEAAAFLLARHRADEHVRRLAAWAVTSEAANVTGVAMNRGFLDRDALGEDFVRLQHVALHWAALRGLANEASRYRVEFDSLDEKRSKLIDDFVSGAISPEAVSITAANEHAIALMSEIDAKLAEPQQDETANSPWVERPSEVARRAVSLDTHVVSAAFGWLDLRGARGDEERTRWFGIIKASLDLALARLGENSESRTQTRYSASLPDDFDRWVLTQVARALPHVEAPAAEELWRPVLALGADEWHWVEALLQRWFLDGSRSAESVQDFASVWERMISFALDAEGWAPSGNRDHDVESMVAGLFGMRWGGELPSDGGFSRAAQLVMPLFERAASRWFGVARITQRFANLARQPDARTLLLPALGWIADATAAFNDAAWEQTPSLDEALVRYLRKLWSLERARVVRDDGYRQNFDKLLAILTARGSHAAQALRDELVGET